MSAQVVVYLGPARSGKTWELVRQYRDILRHSLDRALWLAPNARAASIIRSQLLAGGLDACLQPSVLTFDKLTRLILADTKTRHRQVPPLIERELLRRVVEAALEAGTLEFFAETAGRNGFLDPLAAHVHELKRRGIPPDAYARTTAQRADSRQHRDLARLYADYEHQLSSHRLLDREGAHWAARDALATGACRCFQNLELVVVDGFTDFTHTQIEFLRLLAERAKELLISLPADTPSPPRTGRLSDQSLGVQNSAILSSTRPDLFAKTATTLAELRRDHPRLEIRELAPRLSAWPALDHLAQHIFRNPVSVPAPPVEAIESLDRLEIIAAAGTQDEMVQIARRIKQLLFPVPLPFREGLGEGSCTPDDIVVVFRSLADAAPRVREVFDQFGIPYYLETALPVATAPVVNTLLAALRLDNENWPFRRVVSVITNNTLSTLGAPARQAADWLIRELQIADGRDALLGRVETLAAVETPLEELSEQSQRRVSAARIALPALRLFAGALDGLPQEATPNGWRDALAQLGAQLGLAPFDLGDPQRTGRLGDQADTGEVPVSVYDASDQTAWQSIVTVLAAFERLDVWLGQPPRKHSRRDLIRTLADIAKYESLPRLHDDVGRVRVLGAPSARTVTAKHVFLAGMSELSFPSPERPGQLATDAVYSFLSQAADQTRLVETAQTPTRAAAEMLLFYEVLNRAEESLTISYPALDDKAQELPPSPYVVEIERVLGKTNFERARHANPQLSPVPMNATPFNAAEWRQQAVAQALGENRDLRLLAGLFRDEATRPLSEAVDAGLRVIHGRGHGDAFGPMEGVLASPAIAARLAQRFGPEHLWSPSQWERYAACPFKFYLEDVLDLAPIRDLTLEVDHSRRGSLVHDVLAMFHQKLRDAPAETLAILNRDEKQFEAELSSTLEQVMEASGAPRVGLDAALVELDRRQIQKWIAGYREQHEKYDGAFAGFDEPMRPAHFELRFGRARKGESGVEDADSVNTAYRLDIGGEQVLVTGRIDRIDVGRAGGKTVFNVIDYKSGPRPSLTGEKMESGERLQPALYVMAAQALVFGDDQATPVWAGYWSMKNGVTTDGRFSLKCSVDGAQTESWKELSQKVVARIGEFVRAIRTGGFPVFSRDANCTSTCEFHTVCRVGHVRSLNKLWPPESAIRDPQSAIE